MAMNSDRLEEIRRKTEAATRGPWRRSQYGVEAEHHDPKVDADIDLREAVIVDGVNDKAADLDFCAMARTAIPELLEEVKRLRAALTSISGRFRREDDGTLKARDGVAWAMATDAEDALR